MDGCANQRQWQHLQSVAVVGKLGAGPAGVGVGGNKLVDRARDAWRGGGVGRGRGRSRGGWAKGEKSTD
jgi:hypothetical protein